MKKILLLACCSLLVAGSFSQTISQKLQTAFQKFSNDTQLKHAISSLYVIDAKSGKVVFDKNSQVGLVPASTQKIITAATAFELLGKDYRIKTEFGYDGEIDKDTLRGNLYLRGSGDPTFGSWRYKSTSPDIILNQLHNSINQKNIKWIKGNYYIDERKFETQAIPNGWIWEDIGNYYSAGSGAVNWKENQHDYILKSGKSKGDEVKIVKKTFPKYINDGDLFNELKTGNLGSGDNAVAYFIPRSNSFYLRGTIPPGEDSFAISLSSYSPSWFFYNDFNEKRKFQVEGKIARSYQYFEGLQKYGDFPGISKKIFNLDSIVFEIVSSYEPYKKTFNLLYNHYSPSLDSIIYWFMQKSINLYGEALIKTFAYEKKGFGSTDSGIVIVKDFWKQKGIDADELIIGDGSGLSPQNRVTTHAQVEILNYAKKQSWFSYFYDALPEYNKMRMKSGTIKGAKGFTGYHTSKSGNDYIFSFLVNNYNGSPSALVKKMLTVLNVLK